MKSAAGSSGGQRDGQVPLSDILRGEVYRIMTRKRDSLLVQMRGDPSSAINLKIGTTAFSLISIGNTGHGLPR